MIWRHRKVLRDRAAGLVFDWRRGHGSLGRMVFALLVSAGFWGVLLGYVRVREPVGVRVEEDQIDLTVVDLGEKRNQWLAALIDRETRFQQRWRVEPGERVEREVARLLAENSPRDYRARLREITLSEVMGEPRNLPGYGAEVLPDPDLVSSVTLSRPPANWWIEVRPIAGEAAIEPFAFPFSWPEDPALMSEGDSWLVVVAIDEGGAVVSLDGGWEKAGDPRTAAVLEEIRGRGLSGLKAGSGLRLVRLEARLVNRKLDQ